VVELSKSTYAFSGCLQTYHGHLQEFKNDSVCKSLLKSFTDYKKMAYICFLADLTAELSIACKYSKVYEKIETAKAYVDNEDPLKEGHHLKCFI